MSIRYLTGSDGAAAALESAAPHLRGVVGRNMRVRQVPKLIFKADPAIATGRRIEEILRDGGLDVAAECGGACACATCHVYIDENWTEKVGPPSAMEEDMLDFAYDIRPNSRLSCQIKVEAGLDGLVLRTPEKQA